MTEPDVKPALIFPEAVIASHMIEAMTRYLSGPAFAGFVAWLDQGQAPCNCGQSHAPDAKSIRMSLEEMNTSVKAVRDLLP